MNYNIHWHKLQENMSKNLVTATFKVTFENRGQSQNLTYSNREKPSYFKNT